MFEKRVLKLKNIDEWQSKVEKNFLPQRDKANICIIDDDGYDDTTLRSLGYTRVRVMLNYSNKEDIKPYNVILCDIKGVGTHIDANMQGVAVAQDIKKIYPDKIVIQYSGQNPIDYDEDFKFNNQKIDGFIDKNASTKNLVDRLDELCSMLWNPISAWKFAEKTLRNQGASNKVVAYLENAYVLSLEKNEDYLLKFQKKINDESIIKLVSSILGFLSSVLSLVNSLK